MIKKIDIPESTVIDPSVLWGGINDNVLAAKINEVIDAVNELQTRQENVQPDTESRSENVQDKFAEQRKWIGTLCRCWDSDINDDTWGILQDIKDNKTEKYYLYGIGYEHCEPVKPDDDIIYKKEQQC